MMLKFTVEFDYYKDNDKLSKVPVQMDLGVLVSSDLKRSKHISHISKKANQRLGMITLITNYTEGMYIKLQSSLQF